MTAWAAGGFLVSFPRSRHPAVRLPVGPHLSEHLTPENSPVLFGCRTGICGTCLIAVSVLGVGWLDPPSDEEAELLSILCPDQQDARLACQVNLTADISVERLSGRA